MKKIITILLAATILSTSAQAATGISNTPNKKSASKKISSSQINQTVKYTVLPNLKALKAEVQSKFMATSKQRGFFYTSNIGSSGFIFQIASGEMPNAGYGIKVKSVKYSDGKMKIIVEETLPKAGVMYAEQLTYPTVTFKAPLVSEVVEVQNTKGQKFQLIMPNTTKPAPAGEKETININKVSSLLSAKLLVPEGAYDKELSMTELNTLFGRNPFPSLPDSFTPVSDKVNMMFKQDGNIFYMSEYTFTKDQNDPTSPSISFQLNKGALPLKDCFYTSAPKESVICNTKLVIGSIDLVDTSLGQNLPGATYTTYTSQFICDGIGYDITAKRIDEQSFLSLLKAIIKR